MRFLVLAALVSLLSAPAARPATDTASPKPTGFPASVGATFRDRPFAPQLVVLPSGLYVMGASAEEGLREGRRADTAAWEQPRHRVVVSTPLAVGKNLVTREEFAAFVSATKRPMTQGCMVLDAGTWQEEARRSFADPAFVQSDQDPAVCVAVEDAEAYAAWLSRTTGHPYRLLHEAEWEYAARAGSTASRWWGDDRASLCRHVNGADLSFHALYPADEHANTTCDDRFAHSNPAGAFAANPFGLNDMLGNVWQWTADCFVPGYETAPAVASTPIESGDCSRRAIRGGSWHNSADSLRSAARFWLPPDMRSSSVGFRVVRLPDAEQAH